METPVFVRTASKSDLPAMQAMLRETWHNTYDSLFGAETATKTFAMWHSLEKMEPRLSAPRSEFILADTGEEILGIAYATQEGRQVQLHQLYVSPHAQGSGVGLSLLQEIFFCFDDADKIVLEVHPDNAKAIAFYERQGFSETGKADCNGHAGLPAIVMELNLTEM